TEAPAWASAIAMAAPRPLAAPVTRATLLSRRKRSSIAAMRSSVDGWGNTAKRAAPWQKTSKISTRRIRKGLKSPPKEKAHGDTGCCSCLGYEQVRSFHGSCCGGYGSGDACRADSSGRPPGSLQGDG